jgi:hypothetical protein
MANVLKGEEAIKHAEATGGRVRVANMTELETATVRAMLATATADVRAHLLQQISVEVDAPAAAK